MAHLIDETTGTAAIAFRGETPWHGLGQEIAAGDSLETIQKKAGLAYEVLRAPVEYTTLDLTTGTSARHTAADREVLFRSDTKKSLGVVGKKYQIHQPREIVEFFRDLVETAGFSIEVAGAIREGKRIWALANVNREACVVGDDLVKGYLLLSTSFDGSAGTRAQYTDVRVVCNNTLSAADAEEAERVVVYHSTSFDADKVKDRLGIVAGNFDRHLAKFRTLSAKQLNAAKTDAFLVELLRRASKVEVEGEKTEQNIAAAVRQSKGYKEILALFDGAGKGADLPGVRGTAWGLLNAVTEYVDHHAGRAADSRLDAAWFGKGQQIKADAFERALAIA